MICPHAHASRSNNSFHNAHDQYMPQPCAAEDVEYAVEEDSPGVIGGTTMTAPEEGLMVRLLSVRYAS
jgi:hypothetical protein